jgi:predicted nucleic acid-binding Zn ribbon protein
MPIRSENKAKYPANWKEISEYIRFVRANNHCEICGCENYKPHPITGSMVILTTMHLDHDETNCDPDNLKAGCQLCHNRYDAPVRRARRRDRLMRLFLYVLAQILMMVILPGLAWHKKEK